MRARGCKRQPAPLYFRAMRAELVSSTDARLRLALVCLLLGVYLLIYIPKPDSADGDAVLAVAAGALREGSPNINAVAYADWLLPLPASRMGAFGVDGALYAKKGPTPSLALLPLVALADALPWLTTRATAMLLNPLVTAVTAALLYTLARRLGCTPRVAFALSLIYGLATFAVVYVKTLFGEPLAALLLLLAVIAAHDSRARGGRSLLVCGAACGLLVGVNTVYILIAGVVGVYALARPLQTSIAWLEKGKHFAAFAVPVLVALLMLALYNWARFGSPLDSGYHFAEGEGFTRPILTGLYGLFLSPFRGVFWYNPVLLLALPGWLMLRRRAPGLAWLALVLIAVQALAFAGWWSWHGGIVWGPRFLLPVTPLMVLFLAPLLDAAMSVANAKHALFLRAALVGFVALSLGVQALGALYSYFPYINGYLNALYWTGEFDSAVTALRDEVLYTPELSPIVGHLALAWAGWRFEPAWLARGVDAVHLAAALAVIVAGAIALVPQIHLRIRPYTRVAGLVTLISLNVVVARQGFNDDVQAVRALAEALQPPGTVVAATTLFESSLLDLEGRRVVTMNAPTADDDPWAQLLWGYAKRGSERLWLVSWFGAGDPLNWQARDLWQSAGFAFERPAPGHRVLLFDLSPIEAEQPGGWQFGAIVLSAYGVETGGGGARVTLAWAASEPLSQDFTWFVHLLDSSGAIVAQQDRAPQGGYKPTSAWRPGERVIDRLFFPLPPGTDVNGWQLRVGWLDPRDGSPLPVIEPDSTPSESDFILLPVND